MYNPIPFWYLLWQPSAARSFFFSLSFFLVLLLRMLLYCALSTLISKDVFSNQPETCITSGSCYCWMPTYTRGEEKRVRAGVKMLGMEIFSFPFVYACVCVGVYMNQSFRGPRTQRHKYKEEKNRSACAEDAFRNAWTDGMVPLPCISMCCCAPGRHRSWIPIAEPTELPREKRGGERVVATFFFSSGEKKRAAFFFFEDAHQHVCCPRNDISNIDVSW